MVLPSQYSVYRGTSTSILKVEDGKRYGTTPHNLKDQELRILAKTHHMKHMFQHPEVLRCPRHGGKNPPTWENDL